MDESALYYRLSPNKTLASVRRNGKMTEKGRITVVFCCNMYHCRPTNQCGRCFKCWSKYGRCFYDGAAATVGAYEPTKEENHRGRHHTCQPDTSQRDTTREEEKDQQTLGCVQAVAALPRVSTVGEMDAVVPETNYVVPAFPGDGATLGVLGTTSMGVCIWSTSAGKCTNHRCARQVKAKDGAGNA